ncbi:MAG: HDOD domain-containing protein [Candidatus Auribacterota bacterium]|uniref:HDOD domain-containing protein n=1 Tax=Candidatus Auribacter fodinae TaxID=2093366 RepID=A0A3A4R340_9BACT|nr:MAG: HDOD domain-containing protein [Candidatus Auribacter fodinae]
MSVDKQTIRTVVSKVGTLPTLPYVVTKLSKMLENPLVSAEEVNKVISSDQALTAKVLKLVNSAFYGFPGQISTVTHAVVILGFSAVKSIALSASVFDMFPMENKSLYFDRKKFWEHSIGCAVIARLLARRIRYHDEEEAFVCGLLHDIGKIILDQYLHDEFVQILQEVRERDVTFLEAEQVVMNCTHARIGSWLGEQWSLPAQLRDSIAHHHNPEQSNPEFTLSKLAHLADAFTRAKGIGNSGDDLIHAVSREAWDILHIADKDIPDLFDEIDVEIEKAEIFFTIISEMKSSS